MKLTITHIFLAPSEGQVRRTRVDANDSRAQCATHRSQTDLFRLLLCDRCVAQIHSAHKWGKLSLCSEGDTVWRAWRGLHYMRIRSYHNPNREHNGFHK